MFQYPYATNAYLGMQHHFDTWRQSRRKGVYCTAQVISETSKVIEQAGQTASSITVRSCGIAQAAAGQVEA